MSYKVGLPKTPDFSNKKTATNGDNALGVFADLYNK
jgi:hypothetical protein